MNTVIRQNRLGTKCKSSHLQVKGQPSQFQTTYSNNVRGKRTGRKGKKRMRRAKWGAEK